MSTYKLEVLNAASKGKQIPLGDVLLVGSAAECQLRAQHPALKPRHVRFSVVGSTASVEPVDEGAVLVVNGRETAHAVLQNDDVVIAGPVRLRVIDESRSSRVSLSLDSLLAQESEHGDGPVHDFAKEDLFFLTTRDPALRRRVAFVIPSRDKFLDQAQVFLARLVKQSGASEEAIDGFMTCAKELILNAHRHGHKYDESKRVVLRYHDTGATLELTVEDQGPGFDHRAAIAQVKAVDAATAARERYQAGGFGGLGFQLVVRLAARLDYNDRGNVVTFAIGKA